MLLKVIYFDENSATDYIQIVEGGKMVKTTSLFDMNATDGAAGAGAEISAGVGGIFKNIIGFGAKAEAHSNLDISFEKKSLVNTILQNTILTDFLDLVEEKKSNIVCFQKVDIKYIKDSLSYMIMVSPYMTMIKEGEVKINETMSMDLTKIDNTIKDAKGYFEFMAEAMNDGEKKKFILRFNIDCFKNNYKMTDLLKMKLDVFAINVGEINIDDISITTEINLEKPVGDLEPKYGDGNTTGKEEETEKHFPVYDVVLAGVGKYE